LKQRVKKMLAKRRGAEDRYLYAKMVAKELAAGGAEDEEITKPNYPGTIEINEPRNAASKGDIPHAKRKRGLLWGLN
jgi:hypothetical protein